MLKLARSAMAAAILFGACAASALLPARLEAQPTEVETFSGAALLLEGQSILAPLYGKGINQVLGPYLPGVDLRVTNSNRPQNETTIDGNRYNPLQVIGGFNDYSVLTSGFGGNGVVYSTDGGTTFTHLNPVPGGGVALDPAFGNAGGDPSIDFDTHGRAFYAHLGNAAGASGFQRNNGVFCATSLTGGASWNPTVGVAANLYPGTGTVPFEDKPYVGVDDYVASPYRDRAYVSWTRFYPGAHPNGGTGGGDIMVARSLDNGATWSNVRITTLANEPQNAGTGTAGSSYVQGSQPAIAPNGDVLVAYWFGGRLNCQKSTDGGVSFGPATQPFGPVFGSASIPSPLPGESFRAPNFPSVDCDPTRPNNVYVVCADDDDTPSATDAANVFFARSTDGGATWLPRVKLNDDGLDRNQFWSWMAVNDRGDIDVIWFDTRNDAANHLLDVYESTSTDGGATWSANTRVTDTNFEPNTNQFGGNGFFGDYNGLGTAGNVFHALWTDTRTGGNPEQEIYYDRKASAFDVTLQCPQPVYACPGDAISVQFCITNNLPVADQFCYTITDPGLGCGTSSSVNVGPGATVCIPYNCVAPGPGNYLATFVVTSCSDASQRRSCETPVYVGGGSVAVSCPQDQGTDHRVDLSLDFCFTNDGTCGDQFHYELLDPKGWIVASSAPLSGVTPMGTGGSFCLNVTVHTPIDCDAGEIDQLCWSAYPVSNPNDLQSCCTMVQCTSPTATLVSNLIGRAGAGFAEIEYTLPDESGLDGVNVYRAEGQSQAFTRVTPNPIAVDGRGTYTFVDRSVKMGTLYNYQLGLIEKGGSEVRMGQVSVHTVRTEFALGRPYPNPTSGGFVVMATMPKDGTAKLRVFDVNGRTVSVLHDGFLSAGEHGFKWDGLSAGHQVESGIYFVTYEALGRKASQRVTIMK